MALKMINIVNFILWATIIVALYYLLPIKESVLTDEGFQQQDPTVLEEITNRQSHQLSMLKSFGEAAKIEKSIEKEMDRIQNLISTYFPKRKTASNTI